MSEQKLQRLKLSDIAASPLNPRQVFDEEGMAELTASVFEKGVISPILVRPVEGAAAKYEIVFGERRWRAAVRVAEASDEKSKQRIPALVRELSEEDAYDLMVVENLQWQDLSEAEEAESFKLFQDRNGAAAIVDLAEKIGVSAGYIRRRIAVLELPAYCIEAWRQGELKYGHLEVLSRLGDAGEVGKYFQELMEHKEYEWGTQPTVKDLREKVASRSPKLSWARFPLTLEKCLSCPSNTSVQQTLFDVGGQDNQCTNPDCFRQLQTAALEEGWEAFAKENDLETNGFRFSDEVDHNEWQYMYQAYSKCRECGSFLSLLRIDGKVNNPMGCFGGAGCLSKLQNRAVDQQSGSDDGRSKAQSRAKEHGEYFREQFYQEIIEKRVNDNCQMNEITRDLLALFSLLKEVPWLREGFAKRWMIEEDVSSYYWIKEKDLFSTLLKMNNGDLKVELSYVIGELAAGSEFGAGSRHAVAEYVGIDLSLEWCPTEEYFAKKTKAEILAFGESSGVFENEKVLSYMAELGISSADSIPKLNKPALVRLFMKSGLDLQGLVPDEILSV